MDFADLVTPVTSTNWNEGKLGADESALDGDLDFFGELDAETNVSIVITNNDDSLETGALTGLSLLLD